MALLIDSHNRIWLAPYNEGLRCFNPEGRLLASYTTDNSGLSNNVVLSMAERDSHIWVGTDTTYSRGKSLLQGNLFIVVMAGFQREATDSKKYGQPGQKAGIWIVFHGCFSITLPAKVTVCIDVTKKMEIKSYLCTVLFSCLSSLPGSMEEEAGARLPL